MVHIFLIFFSRLATLALPCDTTTLSCQCHVSIATSSFNVTRQCHIILLVPHGTTMSATCYNNVDIITFNFKIQRR
ncbi:Uncharacterized protein TCM_001467 [Theobroma cacao]|uniref:Secreted protein n=1 Tax=Theobroma cacao TaxID=3641 RepID=A0A061DKE8_THECC|nr:Uncharacterized protein TCM_001467 [Theobroma cacao]